MYELSTKAQCEPCKPKPAPVFKLGDIVEHIHTKDVFKINAIAYKYGDLYYAHALPDHTANFHFSECFTSGHGLRIYKAGKK
jgi:hypothetical protein